MCLCVYIYTYITSIWRERERVELFVVVAVNTELVNTNCS